MTRSLLLALTAACCLAAAGPAASDGDKASDPDGRCDRCGSCEGVWRVCVPVPVEREETKVCWTYRREEVCIPGPSRYCGKTCEHDACGCWWKEIWKPTCARVIPKHVPVKREVTRKVPGVEWQVRERCCHCRQLPEPEPEPEPYKQPTAAAGPAPRSPEARPEPPR